MEISQASIVTSNSDIPHGWSLTKIKDLRIDLCGMYHFNLPGS